MDETKYDKAKNKKEHFYHCILCGKILIEVGLGILQCEDCNIDFLPTYKDGFHSLSWMKE